MRDDNNDPVMAAALAMYRRDGWIDMRALAREAGVGRATLYRRYGDRDELLGEVLIRIIGHRVAIIRRTTRGKGVESVVEAIRRYLEHTSRASHVAKLLRDHRETGLHVLTSPNGKVQPFMVATTRELIREEVGENTDIPLDTLAFAIQRLGDAFYYRGTAGGVAGDINAITVIVRKLLS